MRYIRFNFEEFWTLVSLMIYTMTIIINHIYAWLTISINTVDRY